MKPRIATLMVHTSPLEQAGIGDAGGMNVYVVENAMKMAAATKYLNQRIDQLQPVKRMSFLGVFNFVKLSN